MIKVGRNQASEGSFRVGVAKCLVVLDVGVPSVEFLGTSKQVSPVR